MAGEVSRRDAMKMGAAGALVAAAGCSDQQGGLFGPKQSLKGADPKPVKPGEKVRVGVIGTGGRGRGAHLRSLLNIPEVEIVALCDINREHLGLGMKMVTDKGRKKPEGYDKGPKDYRRMLARDDLHAITQATPCDCHAPMFLDTLKAGKHHYAEKPLGIRVKELDDCCAMAEANPKLIVTMGFQWMYHPSYIEAVKRVHDGEIGDIVEGRVARHNGASPLIGWFSHRKTCGDWMLEQACHEFNVLNWLTKGHPVRLFAIGRRDIWTKKDPGRDVTDFYSAVIEYPNNVVVNYSHDWHSPSGFTGMVLRAIGSKGAVDVLGCKIRMRGEKADRRMKASLPKGVNDTQAAFNTWVKCIREGKGEQPLASPDYGRKASALGLMLRRSIDLNGKVVTYEEMLKTC